MKDKHESFHKDKKLLFNLPLKVGLVGRSQLSGKTNTVAGMLMLPEFYRHDFAPDDEGTNIFIFSPSAHTDYKLQILQETLNIPASNVFDTYDENTMNELYEMLKEEFQEKIATKQKPEHKLFIFDDMSAEGHLKKHKNGVINKIFSNGRHILISVLVTSQKYTDIPPFARENLSGGIFFAGTEKQLDNIADDHATIDRQLFKDLYRTHTAKPHSFFVVNYSNPPESRFMDTEFKPIKMPE